MKQFRFSFLILIGAMQQIKAEFNTPTSTIISNWLTQSQLFEEALRYFTTDTNLDQTYPDASEEISCIYSRSFKIS